METYVWYVIIVVGYVLLSFALLILNKKLDWIYGIILEVIKDCLIPPLRDPIEPENLEKDPGLVFVLIILGPALFILGLICFVGFLAVSLVINLIMIFPRWAINSVVRK